MIPMHFCSFSMRETLGLIPAPAAIQVTLQVSEGFHLPVLLSFHLISHHKFKRGESCCRHCSSPTAISIAFSTGELWAGGGRTARVP